MTGSSDYWNALAPHHSYIENNYFNRSSVRSVIDDIRQPVLVVGAGQGLIVEELRNNGLRCDGLDLSAEMIRYAKRRRRLHFVQASAKAMPFVGGAYQTVVYASGVVDFTADLQEIKMIMMEARRLVARSGTILVAFYRFSAAQELFLTKLGLLRDRTLFVRSALELYRLNPSQAIAWVAEKSETPIGRAALLSVKTWLLSSMQEKAMAFRMQSVFRRMDDPSVLNGIAICENVVIVIDARKGDGVQDAERLQTNG